PAPDQFQFSQECRKLARRVLPNDELGLAQDVSGLGIATLGSKITEQPGPEAFRFAHVDELAFSADHAVNTGASWALEPHTVPHPGSWRRGASNDGWCLAGRVESVGTKAPEGSAGE